MKRKSSTNCGWMGDAWRDIVNVFCQHSINIDIEIYIYICWKILCHLVSIDYHCIHVQYDQYTANMICSSSLRHIFSQYMMAIWTGVNLLFSQQASRIGSLAITLRFCDQNCLNTSQIYERCETTNCLPLLSRVLLFLLPSHYIPLSPSFPIISHCIPYRSQTHV